MAAPSPPAAFPVTAIPIPPASAAPSLWDKISTWAAEHKAVVYTLATVTVVATGAGIYYISTADGGRPAASEPEKAATGGKKKKKSQKKKKEAAEKKAEERKAEEKKEAAGSKAASVAEETEALPEVTEEYVATLSDQVSCAPGNGPHCPSASRGPGD